MPIEDCVFVFIMQALSDYFIEVDFNPFNLVKPVVRENALASEYENLRAEFERHKCMSGVSYLLNDKKRHSANTIG